MGEAVERPAQTGRMKKGATIIPFPDRSNVGHLMRADLQRISDPNRLSGKPRCDTVVHRLPNIAGYYDLINEQCDVLSDVLSPLLDYMRDGDEADAVKIKAINRRIDALARYQLDMLGCASLLTDELLELARVSMTLKVAIEYINTGARRFLDLNVSADHFMLEIAEENIKFASALNQGFYKLATNQLQIEKDIRTALDAKTKVDRVYHCALASISTDSEATRYKRSRFGYPQAAPEMRTLLVRREAYHTLFKSTKRLAWIVNRLQSIVSYTATRT